jgi:hypothetical protein
MAVVEGTTLFAFGAWVVEVIDACHAGVLLSSGVMWTGVPVFQMWVNVSAYLSNRSGWSARASSITGLSPAGSR